MRKRYEKYTKDLSWLEELYKNSLYSVDASPDIERVTEKIEYAFNNGV